MEVNLAYLGRSGFKGSIASPTLSLAPNLKREAVAFDAPLLKPLRFREAISGLHDVMISDLRFKKRDKSAYLAWKKTETERQSAMRKEEYARLMEEVRQKHQDVPKEFEKHHNRLRERYWKARQQYSSYLLRHDMELWRMLMPCDPVITVADDVLLFECFSADESAYGCLSVNRGDGFGSSPGLKLGTTNVDYSWDLYHHFQSLRSYRQTRFSIDPSGFEVAVGGEADVREEKIDLPQSWLKGFMQIQAAMTLPMRKVTLSREAVYSMLAWLKRHRCEASPRGVRFELSPNSEPKIVLEPWEQTIEVRGWNYLGEPTSPIRIWGRRRLMMLSRLLPLVESVDVYLLGTGLPSFWVARMGEMTLTVGLSGWTTNDWTRSSAIDLIAPPARANEEQVTRVTHYLRERRAARLEDIAIGARMDSATALAALRTLAHSGQAIHDLPKGVFRYRQIMPRAVGEAEIGPEHPELQGAKEILARSPVKLSGREEAPARGVILRGEIANHPVEMLVDGDRNVKRGSCTCSYYHRYLLRNGPCRHMIALRRLASQNGAI